MCAVTCIKPDNFSIRISSMQNANVIYETALMAYITST